MTAMEALTILGFAMFFSISIAAFALFASTRKNAA